MKKVNRLISYSFKNFVSLQQNRMNFPLKNEIRQPFYKSQVIARPQQMSPVLKGSKINSIKPSLALNSPKKQYQYRHRQGKNFQTNQKNYVKGYGHLLSPKATKTNNSPLLTYRSAQNYSPRTERQTVYKKQNQVQLEENRSVKFIAKLREQNSSKNNLNQCSRVTKKPQKVRLASRKNNQKNMAQFLAQILKKQDVDSQVQIDNSYKNKRKSKYSDDSQLNSFNQSPERQTFEKKLISKCKALDQQLEIKERQIQMLKQVLKNLKIQHVSQMKALRHQYSSQISKKNSQIQALKSQLSVLQSSIKITGKSKNLKQKKLQQQIQKYTNLLKESEQMRNKMVLQFQNVLKEKLSTKQNYMQEKFKLQLFETQKQNKNLKSQLQKVRKNYEQTQLLKDQIYEENKFLSLEVMKYTKWNQQLEKRNIFLERKFNQSQKLLIKFRKQNQILHQEIDQIKQKYREYQGRPQLNQINQKRSTQQIQTLRFENQSLKNQIDLNKKQYEKLNQSYLKQIQILETRWTSLNKEKMQILEQTDFLRRQIFNLRSLVATLQQSLEQNKMQNREFQNLRKQYQKESREKIQIINNLKIQNIHKQNQVDILLKKSQEIQLALNLLKLESEKNKIISQKNQIVSKETQQNNQSKIQNYQRVSQCLSRIQQLQNQLKELISKFKRQKQALIKKHLQDKQSLMEKIKRIQKQHFNSQLSSKRQKQNLLAQISKFKQKIVSLELTIQKVDIQRLTLKKQISLKETQIQQKIRTIYNMQAQNKQSKKRYEQNLQLKQNIYEERIRQQKVKIKQDVDKMIQKIQNSLHESMQTISTKNTEKWQNQSNIKGDCAINKFDLCHESFETPQKLNSLLIKKKIRLQMSPSTDRIKNLDQRDQLQINFVQRIQEILSRINILNKSIICYELQKSKLQSQIQSESLRIRQEFLLKISELEKKVIQKQYELQKTQRLVDQMKKEKEGIQKQNQKLKEQNDEKQKVCEQLISTLEINKKLLDEFQQKMQLKQKQHRKSLRSLNNQLEQYQANIQKLQIQRRQSSKNNIHPSQNFEDQSSQRSSYQHKRQSNSLIMHRVENRLEQIRVENEILLSQFQAIKDQLQNQKLYVIELNEKIENLQKENQLLEKQNQSIKQALVQFKQLYQQKELNKIEKLQSQNSRLQFDMNNKQQIIQAAHIQLTKINKLNVEKNKKITQLQTRLQKSTKTFTQTQIKLTNMKNQLQTKQNQLQNIMALKIKQNQNYIIAVENLKNQIKSQQVKQQSLQKKFSNQINIIQNNHKIQIETLIKQNQLLINNQQQQIINKQKQIQSYRQQIVSLKAQIQQLHVEIEEWRFICQSNNLNKSLSFQIYHSKKLSIDKKSYLKQKPKTFQSRPMIQNNDQQPNFKGNNKNTLNAIFQVKNNPPKNAQLNILDSIKSSFSFEQVQQSKKQFDSHNLQGDISFF